jgi:hypothetical protein
MFELTTLRASESGGPVTAGQIAEALLYYQRVHVVLDTKSIVNLVKQLGMQWTLVLLRTEGVSAVYCEEMLAVRTIRHGPQDVFDFVSVTLAESQDKVLNNSGARLLHYIGALGARRKDVKSFVRSFEERVPVRKLGGDHFIQGGVHKAVWNEVLDPRVIPSAIRESIRLIPGGYDPGDTIRFETHDTAVGVTVSTNLDMDAVNSRRESLGHEPSTIAHLLAAVQEARADVILAAHYGGDFVTSKVSSSIVRTRHAEVLHRTEQNKAQLRQFHELVVPDAPGVAEAVDGGTRTLKEYLVLLEKSRRLKQWLKDLNPDKGLVSEYLHAVTRTPGIQSGPTKALRYMLTTSFGLADPTFAAAVGLFDTFILEKIARGWRPNHFVTSQLEPFVRGT